MSDIVYLRAHHGLCSQFFIGRGYNGKFIENTAKLIKRLNSQNLTVKIIEHCDDICSCCPKNIDGMCENEGDTSQYDSRCLEEYGYKIGDEIKWSDLKEKVVSRLKAENKLPDICMNCSWFSICENINIELL